MPVRCVSVEPLKARRDVYCLVADVSHAFSVNGGIVVSNCYDEFRYACMFKPIRPKRPHRGPPAGSFQAQRAKLIRARKYARSHGVSLDVAYTKVR